MTGAVSAIRPPFQSPRNRGGLLHGLLEEIVSEGPDVWFQSPRNRGGLLHLAQRSPRLDGAPAQVSIPSQPGRPPSRHLLQVDIGFPAAPFQSPRNRGGLLHVVERPPRRRGGDAAFQSPRKRGGLLHPIATTPTPARRSASGFNPLANGAASFTQQQIQHAGVEFRRVSIPSQTGRPPSPGRTGLDYAAPIRAFQSPRKRGGLLHARSRAHPRRRHHFRVSIPSQTGRPPSRAAEIHAVLTLLEPGFNPLANGAASFTGYRRQAQRARRRLGFQSPRKRGGLLHPVLRRGRRGGGADAVSIPSQTGRPPSPLARARTHDWPVVDRFQSPRKRGGLLHKAGGVLLTGVLA